MEMRKKIKINAFDMSEFNYVDDELDYIFQSNFHNNKPETNFNNNESETLIINKTEEELCFEKGVTRKTKMTKLKAPLMKPPTVELARKEVFPPLPIVKDDFEEALIKIAKKEEERMLEEETEKIKSILKNSTFPVIRLDRISSPKLPDVVPTASINKSISKMQLVAKNKISKQMKNKKLKKLVKKPSVTIATTGKSKKEKSNLKKNKEKSNVLTKKRNLPSITADEILTTPVVVKIPSPKILSEDCPQTFDDLFASLQEIIDDTEDIFNVNISVLDTTDDINQLQLLENDLNNNIITDIAGSSEDAPILLPTSMQGRPFRVARLPGGPWVQVPLGADRFRIPVPGFKWVLRLNRVTGLIKRAKLVP